MKLSSTITFFSTMLIAILLYILSVSLQFAERDLHDRMLFRNVDRIISKIDSEEYTNIHGFLVWKDEEIIGEHYWDSWNGDRPHMLQSATKSITALLIGIAIEEGFIREETQPVLSFFTEYIAIRQVDDHKRTLTLEDLMTMRAGMEWMEYPYHESHLARMNSERNEWTRFVLNRPMKESPGQTYAYNSGGVILLAGIIRESAGMSVQQFANQYLFEPLGITTAEWWFTDNTGLPHTGGGMRMSARDMLKIGMLVLRCGEWQGTQILECEFVNKLFRNYLSEPVTQIAGYPRGYSLLWHVFPLEPGGRMDDPSGNFIAATTTPGFALGKAAVSDTSRSTISPVLDRIIHLSVWVPKSPHEAYIYFTDNRLLESWMTVVAEVESMLGGKYELFWQPEDRENNSTLFTGSQHDI